MSVSLDIVSFAVPFPPNYGGVIDVFYRLMALVNAGAEVRLHCYTYGDRQPQSVLGDICSEVHYYERSTSVWHHLRSDPYIVTSREDAELVQRLARHTGPVLFEGLHTCAHIADQELAHRLKIIRMHNVEGQYYDHLASESSGWRRAYYRAESTKLDAFEPGAIKEADLILAISEKDHAYFSERHDKVVLMPAGHPFTDVMIKPGTGDYVLLQGDLSVHQNLAILPALAPICEELGVRLMVAGRAPDRAGRQFIGKWQNIELFTDVSHEDMLEIMQLAQLHVVDGRNPAGFKLKLLSSLFTGRNVLARNVLVDDELSAVTTSFDSAHELREGLKKLMNRPVGPETIAERKKVLLPRFSNTRNAQVLLERLKELT